MKSLGVLTVVFILLLAGFAEGAGARQEQGARQAFERVKLTVAAKSLTFLPYYFGKAKGIFDREGIDLEIVVMRPPLGITALEAGELEYSASSGVGMRAAAKGLPLRALMFMQTRLSFSLVGQPGMTAAKIRTVAVSGIGSLAHYAAIAVVKKLGRGGPNDKVTYTVTNTTANSYAALIGKATDAAILTPPYTSMATLAGYADLGDSFEMRDAQGGLVVRAEYLQERPRQIKAMIRAVLRTLDTVLKDEGEVVAYMQKEFGLERGVAGGSYRILKHVLSPDGDIEEPVLKSIVEKIKQESSIATDVPIDRVADLSILREARAELQSKGER